ncbi:16S rRNA (cytidine(1402)-2'-O)-methyltransferase [Aliikangiella sp. G2MR2-5]|uniref:16S rRNA (cytidine(1402)-2'-O)-methyltransferase n=1 Tax=Aliikangiella sp. G2MR2-5 TaxID=2788943 RepID=UPI0018A954D4|nr:16S rRNA (cytidine(1402)-2'-O)-methyltransferase [Aliikangiella sp. G2MR2-5]
MTNLHSEHESGQSPSHTSDPVVANGDKTQGVLYVVATPIGNLDDVSDRMRHTLANVERIAAEDTRRTRSLLSHIGVNTPCFSLHEHNERQKLDYIVQCLDKGESIALVSDAGTPLISDPGYPVVHELRKLGFRVVPVPGACAFVAALSVSGLPSDRFYFEGFLPSKQGARLKRLKELSTESATQIFYESSHRIRACLEDIAVAMGAEREVVIARELTKTFETVLGGSVNSLIEILDSDSNQSRGEFVVLIKGAERQKEVLSEESKNLAIKLSEHLPGKKAAKITAEVFGDKKNQIYQYLLEQNRD